MPLTVACVLSAIPDRRRVYNRSHVERLESQVRDNLRQPFQFVCVDDSPFPGWWAKISLFEPGRFIGRVLYFDLDITVVDSLDEVAEYPAPFAAVRDYLSHRINSSVMAWDAGTLDRVYAKFTPSVMERLPGDQDWLNENTLPAKFPKAWFPSYRFDCRDGVPSGAKAIIFHGEPKPWNIVTSF